MINEYTRLAKSIESVSHDQCRDLVGSALDRLKEDVGAIIVDLWIREAGYEGVDILRPFLTRSEDQRPTPMPVSLFTDATGLLVWVAEKLMPVWLDPIDDTIISNKRAKNRCDGALIEGRYVNLYDKTRGFAAMPVLYKSQLRGIITIETDQPGLISEHHIDFIRAFAEPTGIVIWKADSFEERKKQINDEISQLKIAMARAKLPIDSYRTGFVARPFSNDFQLFEDQVKQAFQHHRVRARSYLHTPGTGLVVSEMMAQIDSAHFGIADITTMNRNVFIELGAMIGSGKPFLIFQDQDRISQDQDQPNSEIPFDIQGYQRYMYKVENGSISIYDPNSKKSLAELVQIFVANQMRTNTEFRNAKQWTGA